MLEVERLTKYYGRTMAIEDVSFSAGEGEVVGLLGHNGSGKSTTMSIVTGCLSQTSGSVRIGGVPAAAQPERARAQIGYLPEIPPLYTDMTVDEQLAFAARLRGIPKADAEKAVALACGRLGIAQVRGRLIGNLSKGYRQRVGFAQALVGEPPLLILDEPTVGLDPRQIIELREVIAELGRTHTIILSSHILSEITAVCGRIIVLSNGRVAADGTPQELAARAARGTWRLVADGGPERVAGAVRAVAGVLRCDPDPAGGDAYTIQVSPDADIHRALFYALAEADCPIRALSPAQASLEEVFLQLTEDHRYEGGGG